MAANFAFLFAQRGNSSGVSGRKPLGGAGQLQENRGGEGFKQAIFLFSG
jgi:hypothetical protein